MCCYCRPFIVFMLSQYSGPPLFMLRLSVFGLTSLIHLLIVTEMHWRCIMVIWRGKRTKDYIVARSGSSSWMAKFLFIFLGCFFASDIVIRIRLLNIHATLHSKPFLLSITCSKYPILHFVSHNKNTSLNLYPSLYMCIWPLKTTILSTFCLLFWNYSLHYYFHGSFTTLLKLFFLWKF